MLLTIQYLRAISILMVVTCHTSMAGSFGTQGVDIFFVISGFMMMHIMHEKSQNYLEFFFARFFRIAPLYYLATALILLTGNAYKPTFWHIIQSFSLLKVYWHKPVLFVGWTLEYEFCFYLLCSISILFLKNQKSRIIFLSTALISLFVVIDLLIFNDKIYGHFLEFLLGMMCFFLRKLKFFNHLNPWACIGFIIGGFCALIFVDIYFYNPLTFLRFIGYGIPSFVIVLFALSLENSVSVREIKFLKIIGDASYAIYTFHLIFIALLNNMYSGIPALLSILASLGIGVIVHFYVEKPIRRVLIPEDCARACLKKIYSIQQRNTVWLRILKPLTPSV
jgi:exopolysaccharide production protein ExoZ